MSCPGDILPRWFRLSQAMRYASIGRHQLLTLIRSGEVRGAKRGGDWIVDRLSLDRYHNELIGDEQVEEKVLDILGSVGR